MKSNFLIQIIFEYKRVLKLGAIHILIKLCYKTAAFCAYIILLPITLILHISGFRVVKFFTDRIGHLAIEPACLIMDQNLDKITKRKWIILSKKNRVANLHLLNYWREYYIIIDNPFLCFLMDSMSYKYFFSYNVKHYMRNIGGSQMMYKVYSDWGNRPPIQHLTNFDHEWGSSALIELGIPKHAWYVCLNVREGGFSPVDEVLHGHRNGDINNTELAILEIIKRGGWVVRLGDPSMKKLKCYPNTIDYAHHPLKSERLDVILCARAHFILGSNSGISLVGTLFGVRCALTNMIPVSAKGVGINDLSIIKKLWSNRLERFLTLSEICSLGLVAAQYHENYLELNVEPVENDASEILDLILDIFESIDLSYDINNALHFKFNSLVSANSYSTNSSSLVGLRFLKKNIFLLN